MGDREKKKMKKERITCDTNEKKEEENGVKKRMKEKSWLYSEV